MSAKASKVIILVNGRRRHRPPFTAARAMLEPTLIAGIHQRATTITTEVENYPGFAEAIQGPWLMDQMQNRPCAGTNLVRRHHRHVACRAVPSRSWAQRRMSYSCDRYHCPPRLRHWLGLPIEAIPGFRLFTAGATLRTAFFLSFSSADKKSAWCGWQ